MSKGNKIFDTNLKEDRVGISRKMNNGQIATIIDYKKASDITIVFEDGTVCNNKSYYSFIEGEVSNPNFINPRLGEKIFYKKCNQYCEIINYRIADDIDIQFEDGTIIKNASYSGFKREAYINKNCKSINNKYEYYVGQGRYNMTYNKEITIAFKGMFERCYKEKSNNINLTYVGCDVSEEWLNFQNFAKWYEDNFWTDEEKLYIDKDILFKGNKTYGENTCSLVTLKINNLFIKSNRARNGLIGTFLNPKGRYVAQCNYGCKTNRNIGTFDTEIEAFNAYKEVKERYIKQIADEYKNKYPNFPNKLYEAMYSYKVEITD